MRINRRIYKYGAHMILPVLIMLMICIVVTVFLIREDVYADCTSHNYDNGKVIYPARCYETGIRRYTCQDCGAYYDEVIPKNNEHTIFFKTITKPTCQHEGEREYHCDYCDYHYTEVIPKLAHDFKYSISYHPLQEGEKLTVTQCKDYKCSMCGAVASTEPTGNKYIIEVLNTSVYDGSRQGVDLSVTVSYADGRTEQITGYDVRYENNLNAGTAKAILEFPSYTQQKYPVDASNTIKFTIKRRKLVKNKLIVCPQYVYTGKTIKPKVTWYDYYDEFEKTLKLNRDFTASKKLKKIASYVVTIKGKGNYTGTLKYRLNVVPGKVRSIKVKKRHKKALTVKWKKPKKGKVSGYIVEYTNSKGKLTRKTTKKPQYKIPCAKDFYVDAAIYAHKKVKGRKLRDYEGKYFSDAVKPVGTPRFSVSVGFGEFNLKFKKTGNFQILVSTTKRFKSGTVSKSRGYFFKGDKSHWTLHNTDVCWVKIRQYTQVGKKIRMGKWSKVKKVTVY